MAHIVVLGGGIGGVSSAYELKQAIRREDRVTLVSNKPFFQFTPSNPWVAVKWRTKNDITIDLASVLPKHGVAFSAAGAARVHADSNRVELGDGTFLDYDYLVIATGPELAFDEIEGFGPGKEHLLRLRRRPRHARERTVGGVLQKSRSDRGRRRAGSLVLRPGLRIRDDHGCRSAQASDPRQGADDLRDGRALYRPSRRRRRRRHQGRARIGDAPAPYQMDRQCQGRQGRCRQDACDRGRRRRQAEKGARVAVQVLDDDTGFPRHCGGARHRRPGQSARLHHRRQASAQSEIPQRVRRRRLHRHRPARANAASGRACQRPAI